MDFWSKIPKNSIFGPKFRHFCFFLKFCKQTNLKVLIPNMTIIFSNSSRKIQKCGIFGSKFKNFDFLHETLQQGEFEGANFKNDIGFSKLLPKYGILGSIFNNSNFCTKLCNQTIWRVLIRNITIVFQDPNRAFLFPNLFFFVLDKTLQFRNFKCAD